MNRALRFSAWAGWIAATLLSAWPAVCVAGDLPMRNDFDLQSALEETVGELGLAGDAAAGHLAVALVDVTEPERPRVAMINGHEMFYAASLPKIAILLGAAVQLDAGQLVMDPSLEHDLHDMIRVSCNACATRVLDRVGREDLLAILQSPEYGFYDRQAGGGLWVGKPYGPESAYRRDPVDNQSHGATVYQAARFYYHLYLGDLVSPEQSAMMLDTLARPGLEHKFVRGLSEFDDLEIYRKSGSWQHYHADSALVVAPHHAYIMVALTESGDGAEWLEDMAPRLHRLVVRPADAH
jgi:beta-lactamase class A